jgi:hypothetical protein
MNDQVMIELKTIIQAQAEHLITMQKQVMTLATLPELHREWIPKHELKNFLGFGETQMNTIAKKYHLVSSTIGKRKFFSTKSVLNSLKSNSREE